MFKKLMAVWRGKTFLGEIVKDFEQMLVLGEEIFGQASRVWQKELSPEKVKDNLYSIDRQINKMEQGIRRRLVEHVAIEPEVDVAACLVFMSILKDAERIGDYSKNIFEVALLREEGFEEDELVNALKQIQKAVSENFRQTRHVFAKAELKKAKTIMDKHHKIAMRCEELIRTMAKKEIPSNKAVCYTLLSRYLKRISAHLANIASAIANPVEKIDFVGEGLL